MSSGGLIQQYDPVAPIHRFGRATANRLAEFGASVVCADVSESILADEGIREHPRQHALRCDVADPDSVAEMCEEAVDRFGSLDIMVGARAEIPFLSSSD